jgi:FMN phosphatase YigB (HAD superfamily)
MALLLDMDGVILRNNTAHKHIAFRCQQYVRKITGIKNPIKVSILNKQLYESTGHTFLGLKNLGYPINLDEFNEYVYDDMSIIKNINAKETNQLTLLKKKCEDKNIKIYIFSNAPIIWSHTILSHMNCDIPILSSEYLKPQIEYYNIVESIISEKILFVDDKLMNIMPVINRKRWTTYLFNEDINIISTNNILNNFNIINNFNTII